MCTSFNLSNDGKCRPSLHTQNLHSKLRDILVVGIAVRLHVHLLESMCWQLLFMSACVEEGCNRQVMGLLISQNSIQTQKQDVA